MKSLLLCVCASFLFTLSSLSQPTSIKAEKYPSLLWEITGRNLQKPSYLFGTMHVSSKMVFHLSDSFYVALRNAQVVALETNPATWQDDFSRYDLTGDGLRNNLRRYARGERYENSPQDYLSINSLRLPSFEKALEAALYSNPSILNSFLYRSNSEAASDFEEDTYLDLHIFQAGRKLGKKVCGVEDFDGSMRLVKEAYADAAKDKKKSHRGYDDDLSFARLEEAYRTGNLDLLDTINKVNSQSTAFDEKFLYRRNEIQAASIDSILRSGSSLFVGVGAAHLPGSRGVIEILRRKGYRLRPIKMTERSSQQKEGLEKIRVPVQFSRQTADDGFYTVMAPGKLYEFSRSNSGIEMKQFADMVNGSYYMVTRLATDAAIMGQTEAQVAKTLDSVLYENIPGKILLKKSIVKNGYPGYDITNRTRRGDVQRYNIFITPFEVFIFKMSGTGSYVSQGTEAAQFFGSIQLKEQKQEWKKWSPSAGGFAVDLPHAPISVNNVVYAAYDTATKTAFEVKRTEVHNYDFLEEDTFDLNLMEESFASSDCIGRILSKQWTKVDGYPALDVRYKYRDSSLTSVRFLIQGPHYYTLVANAKTENQSTKRFFASFSVVPFQYGKTFLQNDTDMQFSVRSAVPLEKKAKLQMYPDEEDFDSDDADDSLIDNGKFKSRIVESDSTGEKIYVSFYKPSQYYLKKETAAKADSTEFWKEWTIRRENTDTLQNGWAVRDYELGNRLSSRLLKGKLLSKEGVGYQIETQLDTLSKQSEFVTAFFQSFAPFDSVKGIDTKKKKATLFFSQFFSADSVLHKTAVKNISEVDVDSADFPLLKRCIETLKWKEKKYLQAKKAFVEKLSVLPNNEASDYLKNLYYIAGDTAELQYVVLHALLGQQTAYAYQAFAEIIQTDPPVLDIGVEQTDYSGQRNRRYSKGADNNDYVVAATGGSFLSSLTDSLQLTAGIFKSLLPLLNVAEYEQPVMSIMRRLVDSSLLHTSDYEAYLPKLVLEAKQILKRQLVQEKNKSIEKAKNEKDEKEGDEAGLGTDDFGNDKLSLYASLLLPFWDRNPQVPLLFNQLLQSNDKRLRYDAALLLLRNNRPVPDSVWAAFAALDDYRYSLYTDLKKIGKEALFPPKHRNAIAMSRSKLYALNQYNRPDTLVYLQKVPLQVNERDGFVYVFKYKEKKDDSNWKFATAGLFPADSTRLLFDTATEDEEDGLDFTELTTSRLTGDKPEAEQVEKLRKKLLYSRRKSAGQFYVEDDRYSDFNFSSMR